jgi:RNA polymerase sigma factor (sigma-70 family)
MDLSIDVDVLAARSGDRDAFSRLVTRYRGLVTSISLAALGNVATSEDVAQDVFLSAWRDFGSLRNPSSFLPWLRQLTRHRALDAARGKRRRERRVGLVNEAAIEAAVDPRPDAQDGLLEDERTRAVVLGLEALPDDAREVLTLYYREGQSIEQVARLLGLREDTAKKRLSRARAALREEVLAHFAEVLEATAPGQRFTKEVMRSLPPMAPTTALAASKGALILAIYYFGYRPAKARRRSAEVLADPSAALRHAREDRRGRLSAFAGIAISAAILAFAWLRNG